MGAGDRSRRAGLAALVLIALAATLTLLPATASAEVPELLAQFPEEAASGSGANQTSNPNGVAADPNLPGHVYVLDASNHRIDVFDPWGQFLYAFGWGVNASSPEEKLQKCTVESGCQKGAIGSGGGQLRNPEAIATDSEGNIYVVDGGPLAGNHRIEKFGPEGEFLAAFGRDVVAHGPDDSTNDEVQEVTVAASEGTFKLGFEDPYSGGNEQQTAALPYNASAAELEAALDGLSTIGGLGGSVSVSGGPGDATGSAPYAIAFEGNLGGDDVPALSVERSALGPAAIGATLRCSSPAAFETTAGGRLVEAESIEYRWLRNGTEIPGAEADTYTTAVADEGRSVQCQVRVTNGNGGSIQAANPVYVAPPAPGTPPPVAPQPANGVAGGGDLYAAWEIGAERAVGGPGGGEVVCNKGEWSGASAFAYSWYRNGVKIEGATEPTYTVTEADLASPAYFQCAVTASNAGTASTTEFSGRSLASSAFTEPIPDPVPAFPAVRMYPSGSAFTAHEGGGAEVCKAADSCKAGTRGLGEGQFGASANEYKNALAVSPLDGAVFLSERRRIQVFNSDGSFREAIALPEEASSGINLASDAAGNLYAGPLELPGGGTGVRKLEPSGPSATFSGPAFLPPLGDIGALTLDSAGNLYVVSFVFAEKSEDRVTRVLEFAPGGECLNCGADGEGGQDGFDRSGGDSPPTAIGIGSACAATDVYALHSASVKIYGPPPDPELCPQPVVPPAIASQYAASVDTSSAVLRARINPKFWNDTRYYLEYGTAPCSEGGCASEPAPPGSLLTSKVTQAQILTAGIALEGLLPATTYHYRFVAQSSGGGPVRGVGGTPAEDGAEGTFRTFAEEGEPASCPENEAFRSGASAALPDCRAYEMVSPVEKEGEGVAPPSDVRLEQSSASGDSLTYTASPSSAPPYTQHLATRLEGEGWASEAISPASESEALAFGSDLCQSWWSVGAGEAKLAPAALEGFPNLYRGREEGCGGPGYEALSTAAPPHEGGPPQLQGIAAGGQAAIYAAEDNLTAEAPDLGGEEPGLYYQQEGEGQPHYVCVLPSGEPIAGPCAAGYSPSESPRAATLRGAISTDGQRVFWSAFRFHLLGYEHGPGPIYLRENPGQPQSALAHGYANGTGRLTEGSTSVTSLIAALAKAEFEEGSNEVKLLETEVGRFLAGQTVIAFGKLPTGTTIESCLPECGRAAEALILNKAATASSPEAGISSKGPQPFEVGQAISGAGIPPGTTITEVKSGGLTLSQAASVTESGVALSASSECTEAARACTIAVSAGGEALSGGEASQFWAAAPDGSAALFTAVDTEAAGAPSTLYRFDVEANSTTLIAGKVLGVVGASEDLSRVYFVSTKALTGANAEGASPSAGEANLYLDEEGSLRFIATLGEADEADYAPEPAEHTARVSADGEVVVFMSAASPTGYDNLDVESEEADAEVYRYDAGAGEGALACASCNPSGARPAGREVASPVGSFDWVAGQIPSEGSSLHVTRILSADGSRLFFESTDALSPRDENGAMDVYQWEAPGTGGCTEGSFDYSPANGGCVSLVSSGEGSEDATFLDADKDGSNVFLNTSQGLVEADGGEEVDIYDARVDGGFGEEEPPGEFTLSVIKEGEGTGKATSSPAGIDCGSTCEADFEEGTEVTLSAKADPGSEFTGWAGCGSEAEGKCTVSMSEAREVTASFAVEPVEAGIPLKVAIEGTGSGTVKSSSGLISCSPFCEDEYPEGTEVTLTASPAAGSLFGGWRHCDRGMVNGRQCTVTMSEAKEVRAYFITAHSLTLAKAEGSGPGIIKSKPGGAVCLYACTTTTAAFKEGQALEVLAKPAKHFHLAAWGGACEGTGSCELSMGEDHEVSALFEEDPKHTLTLLKEGGGLALIKTRPAGVLCLYACSTTTASFYEGQELEVRWKLGKGTKTLTWIEGAGTCTGSSEAVEGSCTVSIDAAKELVAGLE